MAAALAIAPIELVSESTGQAERTHTHAEFLADLQDRRPNVRFIDRGTWTEIVAELPYLRGWRRAFGITQEELAYKADTHPSTIRALEHGRTRARAGMLTRLADALGITNLQLAEDVPPEPDSLEYVPVEKVRTATLPGGHLGFALPRLGWWLYLARLTREEAAERSGLSIERVSDLEGGATLATVAEIEALAVAVRRAPTDLLKVW